MKPEDLKLSVIRIDGGTQPRVKIDQDAVADHKTGYELGEDRPPLDVFFDGAIYWLADGFHRWHGANQAKLDEIACHVHQGTQRDAILFSVGANGTHGLRRTNGDKRKAVETLLNDKEWGERSLNWIAEKCGVSHVFVSSVSTQLVTVTSSNRPAKTTGKDGKARAARKRKPKEPKPLAEQAAENVPSGQPSHGTTFDPSEWDADAEPNSDEVPEGLPEHIVPVLTDRKIYNSLQREVSLLKGKVKSLSMKPIGSYIVLQEIERHIDQVKADLKAWSFGDNCPDCENKPKKTCLRCKGRGWIAHGQMGQLSDFHKAWLTENGVK